MALTLEEKRKLKTRCFELLAQDLSISDVARQTSVNKGTISRWKRSKEFKDFCVRLDAAKTLPELIKRPKLKHRNQGYAVEAEDPMARGRFISALQLSGRVDVAAAYSKASPDSIAAWLTGMDFEIHSASAEAYLTAVTELRNIMLGIPKTADDDIKTTDRLRAAVEYARLTDLGHRRSDKNQSKVTIDLLADINGQKQNTGPRAVDIMDASLKRHLSNAIHIDLTKPIIDHESS